ncbi:MAG: anaerobic ribonucleoside-triphosphate reductase [Candidatus Bathyarchaeia archaeon]
MSLPQRLRGVKILKALSSPVRLQILNLLFDRGSLSYTELMNSLKMNPTRDAGRFAYHLKFLLKSDLVEVDAESKKYCLTELGKMVIDITDRLEKRALKPKALLVRTSRFALEEFDVNRIANSLIRETKMPADLAQKIAKDAEKRLLKSKVKYLTAPLVREVVNAILIEKGLEEYRHRLTRLGLPVHDVALLIETKTKASEGAASIHRMAGEIVLKEFMLLNTLPRDVADAHLSGAIHIKGLGSWILKPNEIIHDIRFFLKNSLNLEKMGFVQQFYPPPKNFESALATLFNVLLHSSKEVAEEQTLEYFNIFLAPFIRGLDPETIKEALNLFINNITQHVNASICLELIMPDFIKEKQAIGPNGKTVGYYADFIDESQLISKILIEILKEESAHKFALNPKIVLKLRQESFTDEKSRQTLLDAHKLASENGALFFANLLGENIASSRVFSGYGCKFNADLSRDWEVDTVRTGCLGCVAVNLPRIAYESEGDKAKFFGVLKERLELATHALEIKYKMLKQNNGGLLPFLMQTVDGDQYFRMEHCSQIINFVGLKESAEAFYGKNLYNDEKTMTLAEEIIKNILEFFSKEGKRRLRRLHPAVLPDFEASERLVQWDIERYGMSKVRFSGSREKPFYTTISKLTLKDGKLSQEAIAFAQKLLKLQSGGGLTVIEFGEDQQYRPEELVEVTRHIAEDYNLGFFTYNCKLTYCTNCKRSWFGILPKCPACGSTVSLRFSNRFELS